MKIYTTAVDEFSKFARFFEGHEFAMLPEEYEGIDIDLLLFPGGSDIHPKRYGSKLPENSQYKDWIDIDRDTWEFNVIQRVMVGKLAPKKVLGVCRGAQFLNVCMGGRLTYDIFTRYGRHHPAVHRVDWQVKTVFSEITTVNSSHHQAIYNLGDNYRPRILAIEPNTSIIEAVLWGDKYLGMQFHPELWGDLDEMRILSKGILDWVKGKSILVGNSDESESPRRPRRANAWGNPPPGAEEQSQALKAFMANWEATPPEPPDFEQDDDEIDDDDEDSDDEE